MRKTFVLFACIAVLALVACGGEANTGATVVVSTPAATSATAGTTPIPTEAPTSETPTVTLPRHFTIGQTINVGNTWLVSVLSAKTSTGSAYNRPLHTGNMFLIITISMKNLSDQEQIVSSLGMFNVSDQDGQKYQIGLYADAGTVLDGKVEAGSPIKGVLVYEIPKSVHVLALAFVPNMFESGQTIWDIHI